MWSALPCIKYIWLHGTIVLLEFLDVPNKDQQFLLTCIPLALVTAVGHSMSLAAFSVEEGTLMEAMTCVMEVFEYFCYLRGAYDHDHNYDHDHDHDLDYNIEACIHACSRILP